MTTQLNPNLSTNQINKRFQTLDMKGIPMKKNRPVLFILVVLALLLLTLGVYQVSAQTPDLTGQVLYVRPGANGDCSSWAKACELQTATSNAEAGDQIWVAKGI
jgi:hypothetical protein